MTKVELHFDLVRPLDESLMARLAAAHSIYGIHRAQLDPSLDAVTVEYDATRLTADEVEAALHQAGIPARRKDLPEITSLPAAP